MLGVLIFLLIVWVALSVVGAVIEGLFWLTIIGIALFLGTAALAWAKRRA